MSNHSCVILAWSGVAESEGDHGEETARKKYTDAITAICSEIDRCYLRTIAFGCGHGGDDYACEDVAILSINHFSANKLSAAIVKHAPWLLDEDHELDVMFKDEDMTSYERVPRA